MFLYKFTNKNNFLKKSFLSLILFCLIFIFINWKYSIRNLIEQKDKKREQIIQLHNNLNPKADCSIRSLNEWDPKIKYLFKNVSVYGHCKKNPPFTYLKNSTIYFDSNVNITFYQG